MEDIIKLLQSEKYGDFKDLLRKVPEKIAAVNEDGIEVQFLAARTGKLEIMQYIIERTMCKIDQTDPDGKNCLHYAVESGKLPIVRYLVEKVGFSPVYGDYSGITPYDMAYSLGKCELLDYFREVTGAGYKELYRNPIRTGMFPDPSIVRVGNDYYMVNSTFIYFPCLPISHSTDLIHWEIIGHAITNPDWAYLDELEGGRGYWAPDISYHEGRYYITATYRLNDTGEIRRRQMVVSSDRPEGPYSEPAFIEEDGIDPSIFHDDDGKKYMLLNRGARILELSQDAARQVSEAKLLYYGDNKHATEGPHLLKKDGWYYLFLAEGGTGRGHMVNVARSKSLFGNYEPCPYNPIMTQRNPKAELQCCGHGKPVMTQNGDWYMVYLCYRYIDNKYGILGRETALDPITWTPDGWPIVNSLKGPSTLQKKPILPFDGRRDSTEKSKIDQVEIFRIGQIERSKADQTDRCIIDQTDRCIIDQTDKCIIDQIDKCNIDQLKECVSVQSEEGKVDHFEEAALGKDWCFPRAPEKDGIHIHNSHLCIKGSRFDLDSIHARNIVLQRQRHFCCEVTAKMKFPGLVGNQNTGLVCYYDENTYLKYAVYLNTKGDYELKVYEKIGDDEGIAFSTSLDKNESLYLQISAEGLKRTFRYGYQADEWITLGCLENVYYLCSEAIKKGKRFTGAMVGMYAVSFEEEEQLCGEFDYFQYKSFLNMKSHC